MQLSLYPEISQVGNLLSPLVIWETVPVPTLTTEAREMTTSDEARVKVIEEVQSLVESDSSNISDETPLIGSSGALDSMKIVQLCVNLEDLASEIGFEFDWTSEEAMSRSRGMFRSAGALADEFIRQMQLKI